MSETAILQRIRLALGTVPGLRLFRNNTGALRDHEGRLVRFGLHPGSPDLVGWRVVTVTPDMVGQQVALFTGIEVKTDTGAPREDQVLFLDAVRAAGGLAGVARNPEQARLIARVSA